MSSPARIASNKSSPFKLKPFEVTSNSSGHEIHVQRVQVDRGSAMKLPEKLTPPVESSRV